ncbi:MAG TPA: ABC transporter permease [Povalibacter sp.]|uniref:FtsX-like permease family protein n=1 Tax=Povalibacter sp. TaxID=1962978 RepID=UPI002C6BEA34|nr:FtsX-like permease family protein [Povalibacter sp.]HMN44897.1 ABC transporter permease [Povalibacter sp.]
MIANATVLNAAVFGPMRHAPGRTVLAVLAIALGVALGLAIHLINRVAADEISLAARSLFGQADLAVEGDADGFDEAIYPRVARLPGIAVASPVVQVEARVIGARGALTVLGMDIFQSRRLQPAFATTPADESEQEAKTSSAEPIFLSASAARSLGLQTGAPIRFQVGMQSLEFVVGGVLPDAALADRAAVLDIATTQWKFERLGRLSRLNLRLASGTDIEQARTQLRTLLPPGVRVVVPEEAADEAASLSRAYRSNLTALALVALFTGGFFVYSTQSLSALRRRREFALLHALGVTRSGQWWLALFSGALIGLAGSMLGVLLGVVLAQFGLQALASNLGAGLPGGTMPQPGLQAVEAIVFCLLGAAVAVAGTLRPAWDASRIPTALALKAADVTSGETRTHGVLVAALLLLSVLILFLPPVAGLPLPGYVSIALLIIGTVIAMPLVLRALLTRAPLFRSVPWEIAVTHLRGTARYATLSVSAIVVSFSLMVAMAIMVASFRHSLDAWTQRLLPADLYLRAGYVGQSSHFDPVAVAAIRDLDAIGQLEVSRFAEAALATSGRIVTLIARDIDPENAERVLWLEQTASGSLPAGSVRVWLSEAVADELRLPPGATFDLRIDGRTVSAWIQGVWRDYEHSRGAIIMERIAYLATTGDTAINTLWLWLKPGATTDAVQAQIRELLPANVDVDMRVPAELRRLSLQAFDRTFAITYVLELIAILIGLFGISAGTSAQVLARRREFGVLRHIGLTRAQIAATLAIEGAGLGALGVIAGLATGGLVSLILIYVVNRQSFHWSMDLFVPSALIAGLSVALIAAAAVIAVVSGRQATRGEAVAAVKEDW